MAQKARSERISHNVAPPVASEKEGRLYAKDVGMGKKCKITRDKDRDISEKVALGMSYTKQGTQVMHDEKLLNQDNEAYGGADEQLEKTDKGFTGASERAPLTPRDRPVEFESDEADPFGLDEFLTEVRKGKKAMES